MPFSEVAEELEALRIDHPSTPRVPRNGNTTWTYNGTDGDAPRTSQHDGDHFRTSHDGDDPCTSQDDDHPHTSHKGDSRTSQDDDHPRTSYDGDSRTSHGHPRTSHDNGDR